jgi:hypothetical protein
MMAITSLIIPKQHSQGWAFTMLRIYVAQGFMWRSPPDARKDAP